MALNGRRDARVERTVAKVLAAAVPIDSSTVHAVIPP